MENRTEQILDYISGLDGIQILSAFEELLAMPALRPLVNAEELAKADSGDIPEVIWYYVYSMDTEKLLDIYYKWTGWTPEEILQSRNDLIFDMRQNEEPS